MPFMADHPFCGVFALNENDEIIWDAIGIEPPEQPEIDRNRLVRRIYESDHDSTRFCRDDSKDLDCEFEEDGSEYIDD